MRERILLNILRLPVAVWMRTVFHTEIVQNDLDDSEGPAIFIGNHVVYEDPIMAILYTNRPISFLAAKVNYDHWFKKIIFDIFHIVPFTKGEMDIKALKQLKKYVDKGRSVGLYPEGNRTWDGSTLYIIESISKLIKLVRLPVYYIDLQGAYFINPRWKKNYRKGKIKLSITKIMDKDQVKQLNSDEVLDTVKQAMVYNEYERQREEMIEYKGRNLAQSVEKVLYKCPHCMAVSSFTSKGDEFWCTECGKKSSMDKYGFIQGNDKFDNLSSWNTWQKDFIEEMFNESTPFVNKKVKAIVIAGAGRKKVTCDMIIDKDGVTLDGRKVEAKNMSSPNLVFTDMVEFYEGQTKYRVKVKPTKHTSITLIEQMLKMMVTEAAKERKTIS